MLIGCVIPLWYLHIAWASALLVLTTKAMPEPLRVGRVAKIDSHAFLFISHIFCLMSFWGSAKDQISRYG